MTFDLFTLAAQIVNFVILLVLLRIFLYRPVRRAMHERERRITEKRDEATEARDAARREKERLDEERDAWERYRRERDQELEKEVSEAREQRLAGIEQEVANARRAMADALERDRDDTLRELRGRSLDVLANELRRALHDLADASLEQQALATFRARLERLDDEERAQLRDGGANEPVVVSTSFALDPDALASLVAALREQVGDDVEVSVERDRDLGFGVVLQRGGIRVAWSADAYADTYADAQKAAFDDAIEDLRGASSSDREGALDDD